MFFVGLMDGLDDDGWKQIGDTGNPETNSAETRKSMVWKMNRFLPGIKLQGAAMLVSGSVVQENSKLLGYE